MSSFVDDFLSGLSNRATVAPSKPAPSPVSPLTMPKNLALPLLDYQEEAVEFALRERSAFLALDMGLGKTACAIALAVSVITTNPDKPVLIVVPPSLRINWVREFHKFAPGVTVGLISGKTPTSLPHTQVIVSGDSTVTYWAEKLIGNISALIVDEAHRVKNKDAQRTKAVVEIAQGMPDHSLKVLMSGTPTPNGRTTEMVSAFNILDRWRVVGGKSEFYKYFAPPANNRFGGREHIPARLEEMGEKMRATFMLRRLRHEVIDLPNKGRTPVALDCRGTHATQYLKAEQDIYAFFNEKDRDTDGLARAEALVKLNTLRMMAGRAKVAPLIEMLKEMMEDDKSGIFVVAEHSAVMDELQSAFPKSVSIRGGMSDADKTEAVDAFNKGEVNLLFGQIVSAGVGLTLHGNGRNHRVVFAQIPWTPADLRQAEDRLHRIGQTHDVEVTICLSAIEGSLTIDERLWKLLDTKAFSASTLENGVGETLTNDAVIEGIMDSYRF